MHALTDNRLISVLRIKSEIVRSAGAYLRDEGFVEILPVILSPITDPLHHETYDGTVDYYGTPFRLTKSMILHKQLALRTLPRVFCFSPNVRMEPAERAAYGRYLAEFVQLDLEMREASRDDAMAVGEGILVAAIEGVTRHCNRELSVLARKIDVPSLPLERIPYSRAVERFGEPFDDALSARLAAPAWVIDFPQRVREFYDREDPARPGTLLDMDLVYAEGYGEALSGGEREHELDRIRERIARDGLVQSRFADYLREVKRGIPASAGFGIGVERLTRYICGLKRIEEARLFPKAPGRTDVI